MIKSTWFLGGTACPDGDEIRKKVFVNEQKYPISVEFDDHDKTCDHLLLTVDGTPAATARVFMTDEQTAKIGRLAVLKEYRGQHLGAELIKELIKRSKALGAKRYTSAHRYMPFRFTKNTDSGHTGMNILIYTFRIWIWIARYKH